MRRAFVVGLALVWGWTAAHAQDGAAAPSAPAAMPAIQLAPVQTPVITNAPAAPGVSPGLTGSGDAVPASAEAPRAAALLDITLDHNDFQQFIAQTTGQRLPLYGYDLFRAAPSTFAPVQNVPVTPDYLVGPGDELLIRAWGQIDVDYRATVDRNGAINIPRVGTLQVAGTRYQDLTALVKQAVSKNFRNFELIVTLGQLRSIQVFVVGQARRPGAYTVSSLSTLVNALFAAGGPSTRGSMRAIQLKRGGLVVTEFDLYDLLLRGDKTKDASLLPGDVIYFPPAGPLAAVSGSVRNPAIFELKGAASVVSLIDYAGGLTTTAQTRLASIERIQERDRREVDQFSLDAGGMARTVKDGDLLSVYSISPKFENAVSLRGNVAAPLRYPFRSGMRVLDLIPEKDALITPDYYLRKNLAVRVEAVAQGSLAASVRQLADSINWDYAVIERQNEADLSPQLIPFNLGKAVLEGDASQNLPLKAGDVVTVFSKTDVRAPAARRPVVVSLEGEFNHAGVYQALPGETLRQLVLRAGGLTENAYVFGAEFMRESTKQLQEERLKRVADEMQQAIQRIAGERARGALSSEDVASAKQEFAAQQQMLARLRGLRPTGRIVLEVPEDGRVKDIPDVALEDGDRLFVPAEPSSVSVFGSVYSEAAFLYRPEKGLNDYLAQAGGARKEADEASMYVVRADGSVVSRRQGWLSASINGVKVMPGDAIVVPEELDRTPWSKHLKDWTQIFYQFGLGAAALKIIRD
jgi:protein involved in polysaccharide export with SLBB domain